MNTNIVSITFLLFFPIIAFSQKEEFSPRILLGLSGSNIGIAGDVRPSSKFLKKISYGVAGKFQFSKIVSLGIDINKGTTTGENLDTTSSYVYSAETPWIKNGYTGQGVIYNYKMNFTRLGLNLGISTNANKKISIGVKPSIGILMYNTKVNALDATNQRYSFTNFDTDSWDNTYESEAENESNSTLEYGIAPQLTYNTGKGLYITLSTGIGFTGSDLLDGQQWLARADNQGNGVKTQDKDSLFFAGLSVYYDFKLLK